jgi:hypothetical protein
MSYTAWTDQPSTDTSASDTRSRAWPAAFGFLGVLIGVLVSILASALAQGAQLHATRDDRLSAACAATALAMQRQVDAMKVAQERIQREENDTVTSLPANFPAAVSTSVRAEVAVRESLATLQIAAPPLLAEPAEGEPRPAALEFLVAADEANRAFLAIQANGARSSADDVGAAHNRPNLAHDRQQEFATQCHNALDDDGWLPRTLRPLL